LFIFRSSRYVCMSLQQCQAFALSPPALASLDDFEQWLRRGATLLADARSRLMTCQTALPCLVGSHLPLGAGFGLLLDVAGDAGPRLTTAEGEVCVPWPNAPDWSEQCRILQHARALFGLPLCIDFATMRPLPPGPEICLRGVVI
jgi:hypothetical protein